MAINLDVLRGACAGMLLGGALVGQVWLWLDGRRQRKVQRQADAVLARLDEEAAQIMASEGWQECGLGAFGFPQQQPPQRTPDMVEQVLADLRHYCPLCGETGPGLPWACETHLAHLNGLSPVPIPNHILMIAGPFTRADLN